MLDGVKTTPGYAGGTTQNPTYEQVCSGTTGHAEVIMLEYDPTIAPLEKILDIFFKMHDPTQVNRQGNDIGAQYRSIILYTTEAQKKVIEGFISDLQKKAPARIMTEVRKLGAFYQAEEYHKDYFKRNPANPYCIFVIRPKVSKIKKEFPEL
ncbi:MAG: peptide-methionine (S)-S-oxide reductase MsrA [Candidatus Marsarchaeota archaeon]|nr:peptide-methionine (S)-S-oxide reductase MsrA [Candidatus Marsarchaeota archaeon]MCL5111636.1 peptide-methionine (S)-S-oxide reductase MsrA [Candidatus Marsarchaeota archaeon]